MLIIIKIYYSMYNKKFKVLKSSIKICYNLLYQVHDILKFDMECTLNLRVKLEIKNEGLN